MTGRKRRRLPSSDAESDHASAVKDPHSEAESNHTSVAAQDPHPEAESDEKSPVITFRTSSGQASGPPPTVYVHYQTGKKTVEALSESLEIKVFVKFHLHCIGFFDISILPLFTLVAAFGRKNGTLMENIYDDRCCLT
jgi:hypothetical protein